MKNTKGRQWHEIKCPVCEKMFIPSGNHSYEVEGKLVCSYTCREKGKVEKRGYRKM